MKIRIRVETEFGWGETRSHDLGTVERDPIGAWDEDFGLSLAEGKSLLKEIQRVLLQDQVEEISEVSRVCRFCGSYLPVHDRRERSIDTLFGRITVAVPRVRMCMCGMPGYPKIRAAYSPLTRVLRNRATPELEQLQAELAARHSFREAARLLNMLTPCARQNHMTIRNRLASVADRLEAGSDELGANAHVLGDHEISVFLDSAYVRSRPEYQRRNFEVVVGAVEDGAGTKRRFGLSLSGTDHPLGCMRKNLAAAGWREGDQITVLSDGDPALPRLVRTAIDADVNHILDWWHISIRIRHVETTCQTLLSCLESSEADEVLPFVQNLRWRVWHGQTGRALEALEALFRIGMHIRKTSVGSRREAAFSVVARAMELRTYLEFNRLAVANYARRRQQGRAVSTSRAEGLVNDIANTRMGKKQRMRWSPRGAHRMATVRAAVLDGRLSAGRLAAA
jgi:hypothetical protein